MSLHFVTAFWFPKKKCFFEATVDLVDAVFFLAFPDALYPVKEFRFNARCFLFGCVGFTWDLKSDTTARFRIIGIIGIAGITDSRLSEQSLRKFESVRFLYVKSSRLSRSPFFLTLRLNFLFMYVASLKIVPTGVRTAASLSASGFSEPFCGTPIYPCCLI